MRKTPQKIPRLLIDEHEKYGEIHTNYQTEPRIVCKCRKCNHQRNQLKNKTKKQVELGIQPSSQPVLGVTAVVVANLEHKNDYH